MRIPGSRTPLVRLLRALTPTLAAFTVTVVAVLALGGSAHWWVGVLAGFPAVLLAEAALSHLGEIRRRPGGPPFGRVA